jgi:2-phospho-L-lactate transferase/gluconeogenesis factor (CofD/UPF0052 family)
MIPGGPRVTALGGGHGLAATLAAARRYAGQVTAVVSVADDGGSSGRLREITGIPAPGDLRRCLGALADPDSVWSQAFEYRFPDGELGGHAFGNLVIVALAEVSGDFATALEHVALLLQVEGRVLPATTGPVDLVATINGREVVGQVKVAASDEPIERLWLHRAGSHGAAAGTGAHVSSGAAAGTGAAAGNGAVGPSAPVEAVEAVAVADQVVLGPGSLYTSLLATAVVPDLARAIAGRRAGRVFVSNLRAVEPEAGGYLPADQLRVLLDHGVAIDTMVYDPTSGVPTVGDLGPEVHGVRCVAARLAAPDGSGHDTASLARVLAGLI